MHTPRSLSMRDPARAILLDGFDPSDFGADFGLGTVIPSQYPPHDVHARPDFGADYMGDFGWWHGDMGADVPPPLPPAAPMAPAAPMVPVHPSDPRHPQHPANQAMMMALWQKHQMERQRAHQRYMLLNPNYGSDVKIEGYSFSIISPLLTVGAPSVGFFAGPGFPQAEIKPNRVHINVTLPNLIYVNDIKVANVSVLTGSVEDAMKYSSLSVGTQMRIPRMTTSTPGIANLTYSGFTPAGGSPGLSFQISVSFEGPSRLTGGE